MNGFIDGWIDGMIRGRCVSLGAFPACLQAGSEGQMDGLMNE